MKEFIKIVVILIWLFTITFALATYKRTQIVDYDVKRDHMIMSSKYNYCPICGEKLKENEEWQ